MVDMWKMYGQCCYRNEVRFTTVLRNVPLHNNPNNPSMLVQSFNQGPVSIRLLFFIQTQCTERFQSLRGRYQWKSIAIRNSWSRCLRRWRGILSLISSRQVIACWRW